MIDYSKLISNIPNLKDGDLVVTNSYEFAGSLTAKQNLIYINNFKNFNSDPIRADWIISVDEEEYSTNLETEKGICCLEDNLSFLTAKNLEYLYHEMGLYIYKIIALDETEEYKYFIIFKKRCCTRCRYRNNACCPNVELSEPETHQHQHSENQRFDFFDFIL